MSSNKKKIITLIKRPNAPITTPTETPIVSLQPPTTLLKETIGSFDIGIKTLSVCIIDHYPEEQPTFRVRKLELISLVDQAGKTKLKCKHKIYPRTVAERNQAKKGRGSKGYRFCGTNAGWWNPDTGLGYCGSHKASCEDASKVCKYTTVKNATDMELNRSLIRKLLEIPDLWQACKTVVLETQMRAKMKKLAAMIMSFLTLQTVLNPDAKLTNIKVISAMHKLELPVNKLGIADLSLPTSTSKGLTKECYEGRKELAIMHTEILLKNDAKHLDYLRAQKKQDDLADSFLQGLCYLMKHSK